MLEKFRVVVNSDVRLKSKYEIKFYSEDYFILTISNEFIIANNLIVVEFM